MTVSTTSSFIRYTGDGSNQTFAIPFTFLSENSNVRVVLRDNAVTPATETLQVEGSGNDYTIVGTNVEMNVAPASTEQLIIKRLLPISQLIDFIAGGSLGNETLEEGLDRAVMVAQQHDEQLDRTLTIRETTDSANVDPILPDPTALYFFRWNATADAVEFVPGLTSSDPAIEDLDARMDVIEALVQGTTAAATLGGRLVMSKDTTTNLDALARKEGALYYDTTLDVLTYDNGSALDDMISATATQTITSKTITGATVSTMTLNEPLLTQEQGSTPSTPASGYAKFYGQTDGLPYFLNDAGTELPLAGFNESSVLCSNASGYASTDTSIGKFDTCTTVGTDLTEATNAANGTRITVNTTGIYHCVVILEQTIETNVAVSVNSSALTTGASSLAQADIPGGFGNAAAARPANWSGLLKLTATDVIRCHGEVGTASSVARWRFRVVRIA